MWSLASSFSLWENTHTANLTEVSGFGFESVVVSGFDDKDNEIFGFDAIGLGEAEISCKKLLYAPIWSS